MIAEVAYVGGLVIRGRITGGHLANLNPCFRLAGSWQATATPDSHNAKCVNSRPAKSQRLSACRLTYLENGRRAASSNLPHKACPVRDEESSVAGPKKQLMRQGLGRRNLEKVDASALVGNRARRAPDSRSRDGASICPALCLTNASSSPRRTGGAHPHPPEEPDDYPRKWRWRRASACFPASSLCAGRSTRDCRRALSSRGTVCITPRPVTTARARPGHSRCRPLMTVICFVDLAFRSRSWLDLIWLWTDARQRARPRNSADAAWARPRGDRMRRRRFIALL